MFRNYLKAAIRNLRKNKLFTAINLAGLAISLAFCLLLFFYIRYEASFDAFHQKKDRLFRLEMTNIYQYEKKPAPKGAFAWLTRSDDVENDLAFPVMVAQDLTTRFPQIRSITRMQSWENQLVRVNGQVFKEPKTVRVDDNFFTNFSFPLLKGNPKSALSSNGNIVLSASAARKYFGQADPIGKTIELIGFIGNSGSRAYRLDSGVVFTVAAVAADAPANSSIQFGMIVPTLSDLEYAEDLKERFNHDNHQYILELADGVSAESFQRQLDAWSQSYFAEELAQFKNVNPKNFHLNLRPLAECHYNVSGRWGHFTNAKNLYQLGCLVIVILLIASLNYVLLAVSNAASRSQEIGVRKVLGANRRAIVFQYWVETQIVVGLALLCGLLLAWPAVPLFDRLMDTQMQTGLLGWKEIVLSVLAIGLLMGVIAGYYPALLISRMKPTSIIKSFRTFRVNPKFSRFLVVLQYTGCVVLMMAAFVVNRQMHYVSNKDLGFDKEQVLMVKNPTWDFDFSQRLHARLENLALTLPSVSGFSAMNGGLIGAYNRNGFTLHGEQQWLNQMTVDYQYFEMLGLPFVQGRPFSKAYAEDSSRSVRPCVVNESLFRLLGPEARIGVYNEAIRGKIIGVVRDYHYASLSQKIEPEIHVLGKQYFQYFLFKVRPGTMQGTIEKIRQGWKEIGQNYPFEYDFLDQTISHMYEPEIRWQQIVLASCYFALFIACLGLFGLSSINAVNRTKEIGIRKVLGASVRDVVSSLSSNFVVLVVLSIVIAIPLAWWMMNNWLEDFAYRIIIEWWMFALVGLSALLIAFLAVSLQAVKAALANPVDSLRTE